MCNQTISAGTARSRACSRPQPRQHLPQLLDKVHGEVANAGSSSMKFQPLPRGLAWEEQAIESKRALLSYLRSKPKNMTMESFLCLTELLRKADWRYEGQFWRKGELQLPAQAAAQVELECQIKADKDRILRKTIKGYRGKIT